MGRSYLPTTDDGLLSFASNFSALLLANHKQYDISESLANQYAAMFEDYRTNLATARAPETRGDATILAKDIAKKALIAQTRLIGRTIGNNMKITDTQRQALGLTIRKTQPTPIPPPSVAPGIDLVSVAGRTVTVRMHDSASIGKRKRPAGTVGAWVYTHVGPEYPSDPAAWTFEGATSRNEMSINFPDSVPAGSQVWIRAAWVGTRQEIGPLSVPITTHLQYGGAVMPAPEMTADSVKLAA